MTSIILIPSDMAEIVSDREFRFQKSNRSLPCRRKVKIERRYS